MLLTSQGQIVYHSKWVILECPKDILDYYWYWIYREKHIRLSKPQFGSHVSIIRGEEEFNRESRLYRKYHNKTIDFQYSNDIQTNDSYYWLPVQCYFLSVLRKELGLSQIPLFGFHLTIGKNERDFQ